MSTVIVQASPEQSVWTAASLMDRRGVKRLPVVDEEDYLVGIVSRADLVRAIARSDDQVRADVMDGIPVLGEEVCKDLSVDVEDGVVTLRGVADRKSTKRIAAGIGARTFGVVEVVDHLQYEWDDDKAKVEAVSTDPRDPSARNWW
jgi:CBS domain-containing protein